MTTTGKAITIVLSLATLGVGGYLAYRYFEKKDKEAVKDDSKSDNKSSGTTKDNSTPTTPSTTTTPIGPMKVDTATDGLAPLNPDEIDSVIKAFQNWMDSYHPKWLRDGTNLNKSKAKGYGKFGPQTKAAASNPVNSRGFAQWALSKGGQNNANLKRIAAWAATQGVTFAMGA